MPVHDRQTGDAAYACAASLHEAWRWVISATDCPPTATVGSTRPRREARGGIVRLDVVVAPDSCLCDESRVIASEIQGPLPDGSGAAAYDWPVAARPAPGQENDL